MMRRLLSLAALTVATLTFALAIELFARDACQGWYAEAAGNCRARITPHLVIPSVVFGVSAFALLVLILLPVSKADK